MPIRYSQRSAQLALAASCAAGLTCCVSAPAPRVHIDHAQHVPLENMLTSFERDDLHERAYVLTLQFSRLFEGSVEQVDVTCKLKDIVLRARPLEAAAGDERYNAYLYTDYASAAKLREGNQRIRCTIKLDEERHEIEREIYLAGPPLGTPFELLEPTLTAFDCETGISPRQGQPLCVHINARNDNLTRANPRGSLSARCQAGGQTATTTSTNGYLPQLQVRFERAPAVGTHELSCQLMGSEALAKTTIEVSDATPRFALELIQIDPPQRHAPRGHDSPMAPGSISAQVQVRALGDSPLWGVLVECADPDTALKLQGWRDVRIGVSKPIAVGDVAAMSVLATAYDTTAMPKTLRCIAQAKTRDGGRVLAQSAEMTMTPSTPTTR